MTILIILLISWFSCSILTCVIGYYRIKKRGGECITLGELVKGVLLILLAGPIVLIMVLIMLVAKSELWDRKVPIGK